MLKNLKLRLLASSPASRWNVGLGLLGLIAFGVFLAFFYVPIAGGSDSSGYLNSAKLLARGELATEFRAIPGLVPKSTEHLLPLGFARDQVPGSVRLFPSYPTGVPLQFAAAGLIGGWTHGLYFVSVGGAMAAAWLCYLCGRELGVSRATSWLGAGALVLSPMFLFIAIQPLSDVLATTWWLARVYAALRAARAPGWALVSGACFGLTVLVRPTNALLFPALWLFLGSWRLGLRALLGGVPAAGWLAFYQFHLYGAPWRSGYGEVAELFHAGNLAPTFAHYATWLPRLLPAAMLVLPLAAWWRWRSQARLLTALAVAAVVPVVFYASYDVTKESWWSLRFLLPAFPAIILTAVIGVQVLQDAVARRWGGAWPLVLAAGLAVASAGQSYHWAAKLRVLAPAADEQPYRSAGRWVNDHLPRDSVVACRGTSGAVFYYTDFRILRFDLMSQADFDDYLGNSKLDRQPLYALLFDGEQAEAFRDHLNGRWDKIEEVENIGVWRRRRDG